MTISSTKCYTPLVAKYDDHSPTRVVIVKKLDLRWQPLADQNQYFNLPCGQCLGCRLEYSRQWAVRIVHESRMHTDNCFVTLTFNEESLMARKSPWSLDQKELKTFIKRLRHKFGTGIRYFACGEYGDENKRPHYHLILHGIDFRDIHFKTSGDHKLYISEDLNKLWPHGYAYVGAAEYDTAAYIARYITKKINGDMAENHYMHWCPSTGEGTPIAKEFANMSRMPGIGSTWLNKYMDDVYPNDYVVINNHQIKPPRFYDKILKEVNPTMYDQVKAKRREQTEKELINYNEEVDRLWVSQEVKINKIKKLVRTL